MANRRNVTFLIGANAANFSKGMQSVTKQLQATLKQTEAIGRKLSVALTAPIVAFGAVSLKAFTAQEDAERKLAAAIRATGGEVTTNMQYFKSFASEMQRMTVVGDETTLALLQVATAQGLAAGSASRAVRNAIAMQSAFGVGAESAIRMTAALEQGDATMLRRYIPALRLMTDETKMVTEAQKILSGAFEIAKEEARTTSGGISQLRNDFGDLQERIGEIVSKVLNPLIRRLSDLARNLADADMQTVKMAVSYAALVAAIGPVLIAIPKLTRLVLLLMSPLAAKIALIAALGVGLKVLYDNLKPLGERFVYYFGMAKNAVLDMVSGGISALGRLITFVDAGLGASLLGLSAQVQSVKSTLADPSGFTEFVGFMESMGNAANWTKTQIDTMIKSFWSMFEGGGDSGARASMETTIVGVQAIGFAAFNTKRALEGMAAVDATPIVTTAQFITQEIQFMKMVADDFTNSFGQGMANVIVQGDKLRNTLRNIGRLLASSAIQTGIRLLLSGGLSGGGFFGSGGGLFGAIFSGASAAIAGTPAISTSMNSFAPSMAMSSQRQNVNVNVSGQFDIAGDKLRAFIDESNRRYDRRS
jgi:hypothetical protein